MPKSKQWRITVSQSYGVIQRESGLDKLLEELGSCKKEFPENEKATTWTKESTVEAWKGLTQYRFK